MARQTTHRKSHQGPRQRTNEVARPSIRLLAGAAAGIVAVGIGVVILTARGGSSTAPPSVGLPNTSDYHSLLVDARNPNVVLLGTHVGIYRSVDGGTHWRLFKLANRDAMNLGRAAGRTVWMAGHDVFARSDDGGTTWHELRPRSLPSLDIHGFAVDPHSPRTVYAAVAGEGLYRSTDNGATFSLASRDVGGAVMALAVAPSGAILAGDPRRGLLRSPDGGRTWRRLLNAQLAGLALNPRDARIVLATGPGVLRSVDGGRTWKQVLELHDGAGPVAWAPSKPMRAYVVGFDRALYRSNDGGRTWAPVGR